MYLLWGRTRIPLCPCFASYFIICHMLIYSGSHPVKLFVEESCFLAHDPDGPADRWRQKLKAAINFSRKCHAAEFPTVTSFTVNCGICILSGKCEPMWWCVAEWLIIFHSPARWLPVYFNLRSKSALNMFRSRLSASALCSRACRSLILWFICLDHPEEQRQSRDQRRLQYDRNTKPGKQTHFDQRSCVLLCFPSVRLPLACLLRIIYFPAVEWQAVHHFKMSLR